MKEEYNLNYKTSEFRNPLDGLPLEERINIIKKITGDIAQLISKEFIKIHDADPVAFMELLFTVSDQVNRRVNTHLKKLRSVLIINDPIKLQEAYEKVFVGTSKASRKAKKLMWNHAGKNLSNLRMMFMAHSDLRLQEIFTFTVDGMTRLSKGKLAKEQIACLFDKISYSFGDLKDNKQDFIILDNPVHNKPFIKLDEGGYFLCGGFHFLPSLRKRKASTLETGLITVPPVYFYPA